MELKTKRRAKQLKEVASLIPKYENPVDSYLISYEAWRRGLDITFVNKNANRFKPKLIISDENNKVEFIGSQSSEFLKSEINNSSSREYLITLLKQLGLTIPNNKIISNIDSGVNSSELEGFNFPLMVSSLDGKLKGKVKLHINSIKQLNNLIKKFKNKNVTKILVEEQPIGEVYQAYVVGDKIIGILKQIPLHVMGNGKNSIKELINVLNKNRLKMPSGKPLKINKKLKDILKQQNHDLNSVPANNEFINLSKNFNQFDNESVFNEIPNHVISSLKNIISSFNTLEHAEIEFFYNKTSGIFTVTNINTNASIIKYLFPYKGDPINIPKSIIDNYFEQSIDNYLSDTTPQYYFDYLFIKESMYKNQFKEVSVSKYPYEPNLVSYKFTFISEVGIEEMKSLILNFFKQYNFNGELILNKINSYSLIVAGNNQDISSFIEELQKDTYFKNIKQNEYTGLIRVGFRLRDNSLIFLREIQRLKDENAAIINSNSWRITAPFRRVFRKTRQ